MKSKIKSTIGYQVPELFTNLKTVCKYISDAGIKSPNESIGKLYCYLNYLRVSNHIRKSRYDDIDGWVTINTNVAGKLYGHLKYFYAIHNKMISDGYVEAYTNEQGKSTYQANVTSKRYRLTSTLNNAEWGIVKRSASKCSITRKIIEFNRKMWKPIDFKLYNLLTQFNIDDIPFFENTTAQNFMESDYDEVLTIREKAITKFEEKIKKRKYKNAGLSIENIMLDIYSAYKMSYLSIKEGAWRYMPDEYGRRHTNITNLPKFLKNYLYIIKSGVKKRLCTIDISNSQVLLLLTILPERLTSYNKFKELVESGNFYNFLANKLGMELTGENRKIIKQQYFTFIYGEHKKAYVWGSNVYKVMKNEFPDIVEWITKYKDRYGYQKPAQKMQCAESDIIIKDVCANAIKQKICFTQIYDSILCLENDADNVKEMITSAFKRTSLNVTLKQE